MKPNRFLPTAWNVVLLTLAGYGCQPDVSLPPPAQIANRARAAAEGALVMVNYQGRDVVGQKKNGLYFLDEDLALAPSMVTNERNYNAYLARLGAPMTGIYEPYQVAVWPKNTVPYVINRSNAYDYRDVADVVKRAVDIWNMSGTKIKFVELASNGLSYPAAGITVFNSISNRGIYTLGLGYFDNQNTQVFIGPKLQTDDVLHEMLHVIGIPHEHQRSIRDNYVKLDADNYQRYGIDRQILETNYLNRFDVYVAGRQVDQFPFDYSSLTLYWDAILSSKTATPLVKNRSLSKKDVDLVNLIANYNVAPKLYIRNKNYVMTQVPIHYADGGISYVDLKPGGKPVVLVFDTAKKRYTYNGELVNYIDLNNGGTSDDLKLNYDGYLAYKPGSSGDKTLIGNATDYWNQTLADCLDKDGIGGQGPVLLKVTSTDPTLSEGLITYIDIQKP